MSNAANQQEIAGYECKHVVYCPPPKYERGDYHLVKEIIHFKDGSTKPNVRLLKDYKRPFWVTKKGYRTHKDKKEWEKIDRLDKFESTQSELNFSIAKALGMAGMKGDPRVMKRSPYLYGSDILSTCVIKKMYMDKFPDLNTQYSVACFDIETDVVEGEDDIIMATLSFKDRVFTAIQKRYIGSLHQAEEKLRQKFEHHIGDVYADRNIKWEMMIVDRPVDIVLECFKRAHEWKPDFIAIWNIAFDMKRVLECLQKAGYRPEDVFSDPAVPLRYRHFNFKLGPNMKVTASGKKSPIPPQAQWHTVFCPASFYFIDAMCVYWNLRSQKGKDPSYSLDFILRKTFKDKIRKLKFEEGAHLRGIDWHQFMQKHYKLEYVVYNVFDCVGMELLDEATKDLQLTMPSFAGWTDFCHFNSQPRRLVDKLHYYCLEEAEEKRVIGSTSDEMKTEMDDLTLGLNNWIVTLPAHLVADNGLCIIEENDMLRTNIRGHVGDLDVSASYPNGECVFNISKETTYKELCKIQGVSERTQRLQGINLSGGATNAVEFACEMFGMPTLDQWLEAFAETQGRQFDIPKYTKLITRADTVSTTGEDFYDEDEDDDDEDDEADF
jgi:hypothetical protein